MVGSAILICKSGNDFWIYAARYTASSFMSTLGVSARDRFISRISSYPSLVAVLWTTNHLLPVEGEWQRQKELSKGVVQAMIAVPASEVPAMLANLPVSR
jgi:hypothetical protein